MHERIKEHDRDIRLSRTESSAVTENANEAGHYLLWDKKVFLTETLTGSLTGLKRILT